MSQTALCEALTDRLREFAAQIEHASAELKRLVHEDPQKLDVELAGQLCEQWAALLEKASLYVLQLAVLREESDEK